MTDRHSALRTPHYAIGVPPTHGLDSLRLARRLLCLSLPQARNAGRNDPCPCGSGKKFKRCCLRSLCGSAARDSGGQR
jgi:hypothetical protein